MPFTPAHSAAVVPLKRFLPLSALVVGSMSPDFEYLFRLDAVSEFSHTLAGIVYFCIPVGFAVLWLFHSLVKRPVLLLLPNFVRQRLASSSSPFPFLPPTRLFLIVAALAIGALSHIVWDSFTHEHGWVVGKIPVLRASLFEIAGREVGVYKLLQHGSTIVGLSLLAYWFWRWLYSVPVAVMEVEPPLPDRVRRRISLGILLSVCLIGGSVGLWSASERSGLIAWQAFVVHSAIGGMAAFAVCVLLFSIAYRVRSRA